jgi:hypothetical protein
LIYDIFEVLQVPIQFLEEIVALGMKSCAMEGHEYSAAKDFVAAKEARYRGFA